MLFNFILFDIFALSVYKKYAIEYKVNMEKFNFVFLENSINTINMIMMYCNEFIMIKWNT